MAPKATSTKGSMARRWAAMVASMSPASRVSTPSTALTFWIGTETDTTRSPARVSRRLETRRPSRAMATSWFSSEPDSTAALGLGRSAFFLKKDRLQWPRLWAAGRGRSSTRSAIR